MILLLPVIFGLIAGQVRAWWKTSRNNRYGEFAALSPDLRFVWLVPIAVIPQIIIFYQFDTVDVISDSMTAFILCMSQFLLLVFTLRNWEHPGFWALGLGVCLNLVVISINGGFMPISPDTVNELVPNAPPDSWQVGERLGSRKDIILPISDTKLWWLSDRFLLPSWFPQRVAFSIGDVFVALGVFNLLWARGETPTAYSRVKGP